MAQPPRPLFLERQSYIRRRAMDAAHLLPLLGVLLVILPVLRDPVATPEQETSGAVIYFFGVWLLLIGLAAWLSRYLREPEADPEAGEDTP